MVKKKLQRIFAVMLATAVITTNFAGSLKVSATEVKVPTEYEIYPVPQSIDYENASFEVGEAVNIVYETGVDIYTKNRVEEILKSKNIKYTVSDNIVEGKTDIIIGINESGEFVDQYFNENVKHDEEFFNKNDSHLVSVDDGVIGVLGKDPDSAFYGVTTLKHVFNQLEDGSISEFRVDDYSDVAQRGFIEGYYGNPWSNEDRAELMKFGGDYKMNQYIFAPKDDPYHNSKWRELYPEAELAEVKKLAKVGNETKNRYVYALHPFMHNAIRFDTEENYQNDLNIIKAKFTQLIEADVRQFSILADDAGVPPQGASTYVRLLNDLTEWLREQQETYPDLKDEIVFCPNDYMGNGSSSQLKEVNKAGDNVSIIATGGRIWGEVSQSFGQNYKNNIASEGHEGRAPFYWINWPCSDNSKQHLIMGGNDTFLKPGVDPATIKGIVLNPMQQAEANKSALFANAGYSWNIWDNKAEADQNWEDSFKYMDHGTAEETAASTALRELSKHMINQNMDSRVTKLEESVKLAPKLNEFKAKYESGASVKEEANELIIEFKKLKDAAILYKNEGHERVVSQIIHWLNCWEDTTDAAIAYLETIIALEDGESNDVIWNKFSEGQAKFEKSKTYGFHYVDHTEYAEVGVQHIVPLIKFMGQNLSAEVGSIINPDKIITSYITNRTDSPAGNTDNVLDGNAATEVVYKSPNTIAVGTYVGVKFSNEIVLKDVQFLMGAAANANDTMAQGKIQYTVDGKEWIDLDGTLYDAPKDVKVEGLNLKVKGVRMVATQDKGNTWLGVKDIIVNAKESEDSGDGEGTVVDGTLTRTPEWAIYRGEESTLTDGDDSTGVWYKTHAGDITKVGDYIGLDLGKVINVGNVHFVIGNGDSDKWTDYKLEYSTDNVNWTTYKEYSSTKGQDIINENLEGVEARYVRVTNLKQLNKWVKFNEFRVESVDGIGSTANIYTNFDSGIKSVSSSDLTKLVSKENITLENGQYIGIKLDRIKDLSEIKLNISDNTGLQLQTSINEVEWTNVTDMTNLEDARYIRLIQLGDTATTFNLVDFEVKSNEIAPPSLMSAYTTSNTGAEKAFDGNFNTSVKFNAAPKEGSTIVYDLGQTINVNNLKYVVLDTEKDHIRDGKIQLSLDGENWTDVINIENNIPNTSADMDSKPTDNGYTHGSVSGGIIPISHAYKDSGEINQEARYLRVVFTKAYDYRWTVINEFLINNGEYIPTVNDPTFVSNPIEAKGFAPSNAIDGDLTTAYKPNTNNGEITSGSLTYRLSEKTNVKKINIVQNGNEISNAKVIARVGKDEAGQDIWEEIGTLDKSLNEIVNTKYENIFEIKIEWNGVAPTIYEIITLNNYEVPNISDLENLVDSCEYVQENYTVNSWNEYSKALEAAKKLLNNLGSANQEAVDKAKENLVNAITGLVDISGLNAVIAEADGIVNGDVDYTEETLNILKEALANANKVLANNDATVEDVTIAIEELRTAIDSLIEDENTPVFKLHLQIAIEEAEKITEEELSSIVPVVAKEFKEALKEAKEIFANEKATKDMVDNSFDRLSKAMQMLEFKKGDKTQLVALVEKINGLDSSEYITSTWDKLALILGEANGVINDENAMKEEVSQTYDKLMRAFLELRLKPSKDKLQDLINKAESLDSTKYTKESFKAVEKALKNANKVFADENATEDEILKSTEALSIAMDNLVLASDGSNNGGNSNNNGNGNNTNKPSNNGQTANGTLPKTGGTPTAAVGLFGTIIATLGAVISRKRK